MFFDVFVVVVCAANILHKSPSPSPLFLHYFHINSAIGRSTSDTCLRSVSTTKRSLLPSLYIPASSVTQIELKRPDEELKDLFSQYDTDNNGSIDRTEFRKIIEDLMQQSLDQIPSTYVDQQFQLADKDLNGGIDYEEFISLYRALLPLLRVVKRSHVTEEIDCVLSPPSQLNTPLFPATVNQPPLQPMIRAVSSPPSSPPQNFKSTKPFPSPTPKKATSNLSPISPSSPSLSGNESPMVFGAQLLTGKFSESIMAVRLSPQREFPPASQTSVSTKEKSTKSKRKHSRRQKAKSVNSVCYKSKRKHSEVNRVVKCLITLAGESEMHELPISTEETVVDISHRVNNEILTGGWAVDRLYIWNPETNERSVVNSEDMFKNFFALFGNLHILASKKTNSDVNIFFKQ